MNIFKRQGSLIIMPVIGLLILSVWNLGRYWFGVYKSGGGGWVFSFSSFDIFLMTEIMFLFLFATWIILSELFYLIIHKRFPDNFRGRMMISLLSFPFSFVIWMEIFLGSDLSIFK